MRVGQLFKFLALDGSGNYLIEKVTSVDGEQFETVVVVSHSGSSMLANVGQGFQYHSLKSMMDNPYFRVTEISFNTYYKACKQ